MPNTKLHSARSAVGLIGQGLELTDECVFGAWHQYRKIPHALNSSTFPPPRVCRSVITGIEEECVLTGYSVDGFQGSEYAHSSDGGEIDVLEIKGVFHHPERK